MPIACSRPPKLNDADTVFYEIYMLRFAAKRLVRERWEEPQDAWVYLEDFLVHYRNLIEFLGKQNNIRDTDLHVTTIWAKLGVAPPAGLAEFTRTARNSGRSMKKASLRQQNGRRRCTIGRQAT
jgi:hypothetical protein